MDLDKDKKKIYIIISNTLGELDVILPILVVLSKKNKFKIKIVFTVNNIYKKFINNHFYLFCIKKINARYSFNQAYSKFDLPRILNKNIINRVFRKFYSLYVTFFYVMKSLDIFFYDYYLHECSNQKNSTQIMYFISSIFRKKIIVYQQGQALTQEPEVSIRSQVYRQVYEKIKNETTKSTFLLFNEINKAWAHSQGYKNCFTIGFPKFYKGWTNLINDYSTKFDKNDKYIVIFTRQHNHKYYMDPDKYTYLVTSSYKAIRSVYGLCKILIKPHPRENIDYLNNIINKNNFKQLFLTNEHAGVLSNKAILTISFWTSTILDSLAQNTPAIEYYVESKNFRIVEPKGSLYKMYGIDSASNQFELTNFLNKVKISSYKQPAIIKEFRKIENLDIF